MDPGFQSFRRISVAPSGGVENVADLREAVGACQADYLRRRIVGRRERRDGVAHASVTLQPCFDPCITLLPRIGFGPVEYSRVRADRKDTLAVCRGEGTEEETLGGDGVVGKVHCWRRHGSRSVGCNRIVFWESALRRERVLAKYCGMSQELMHGHGAVCLETHTLIEAPIAQSQAFKTHHCTTWASNGGSSNSCAMPKKAGNLRGTRLHDSQSSET